MKNKIVKSIFAGIMCASLLAVSIITPMAATTNSDYVSADEEKIICDATLDDDFADNQVLILLNNKKSLELKEYTPTDFPEITDLEAVVDYSTSQIDIIKAQREAGATSDEAHWVDESKFHQMILLTLNTHSKQRVLDVVKILEQYNYVRRAEPNYALINDTTDSIKQAILGTLNKDDLTEDDVTYNIINSLSDGSQLLTYDVTGLGYPCVMREIGIGKYLYYVTASDVAKLYKDGKIYEIKDAYENGIIDDEVLDEIAVALNFSLLEEETTQPVADKTQPATDATSSKGGSTATPDTAVIPTNSDAVKTGQNSLALTFGTVTLLSMISVAVFIFKRKNN